jgi:hypothetical protein
MLLQEAMNHVDKARQFLSEPDETSVRHAALELRLAIERIVYRLVALYSEELTDDVLTGLEWQPQKILAVLVECNPGVERESSVNIAFTGRPPFMGGRQGPLPRKLIAKYYGKLGSFVHVDLRRTVTDVPEAVRFLEAAAARLEQHCRATTMMINGFTPAITIECICGRMFRRSSSAVEATSYAKCPSRTCGAVFDFRDTPDGIVAERRRRIFVCPSCDHRNEVPVAALPQEFACGACSTGFVVDQGEFVRFTSSNR